MKDTYVRLRSGLSGLLVGVLLLLAGAIQPAAAQSGPYGNEWIVPGQQYYKIKVAKIGIYRLDYQYLTQAGLGAVNPSLLQLWRRGRQVAVYQGGNPTVLDATSYLEFYGQRNDGALDADYYKNPATDQPHQLYSQATDTAAYFLTYGVGAGAVPGRRMAQPVAAGGTPHAYRLFNNLKIEAKHAVGVNTQSFVFLPWLEKGEGYYTASSGGGLINTMDSVFRAILPNPAPRLELLVLGGNATVAHSPAVLVNTIPSALRSVGNVPTIVNFNYTKARFPLLRSDISAAGRFGITLYGAGDQYRLGYVSVVAPQANRWFSNRRWLLFQNDSLLGGPATYELDSIPATVRGYDVQDPWNVQRVDPTAATTLGPMARRFVFPSATAQQTRWLFLADAARALVPAPARRVQFRSINPAAPNYIIITHPRLMGPATGTANAALEFARYRASAAGGGYDTLMVTSQQLFDQFHYGERSVLALRHFARWLVANSSPAQARYLLLLGKGLQPDAVLTSGSDRGLTNTTVTPRLMGGIGLDLVPCSSRAVSDNWLSCNFRNNDYVAQLHTGRVVASTPQMVVDYLAKVRAHEQPQPLQAWRKNALSLVGGESPSDFIEFGGYMAKYNREIESPCFNGRVVRTYSRATTVVNGNYLPVNVNVANELNAGLALITYFGHGSETTFDVNMGDVNDPSNNYNNVNKYPMLFFNGCAAAALFGNGYSNGPTFGENWLMTANRGALALMGQTGFGYAPPLDSAQSHLYRLLLNDPQWYGKPVTVIHDEVVRRLQNSPFGATWNAEGIFTEQLLCTEWHGDPVLKLYSPLLPDFQTNSALLSISPNGQGSVTAASRDFKLNIGVLNPGSGCLSQSTLAIRVTRTYDTGARRASEVFTQNFPVSRQANSTYEFIIPNSIVNGVNVFGVNHFRVELDYANAEPELDETNNSAIIDYTFLEGGVTILSPLEFAIVPTNRPRLVAQTNDPNGPLRSYDFQVDTVATFNSPLLQQTAVQATLAPVWQPTLPPITGRDSVVWYWRVRFTTAVGDENPNWVLSSFRVIPNNADGWSQSHYTQFRRDERQGVEVATPGGQWSFTEETKGLVLRTRGGGLPRSAPLFVNGPGFGILTNVATPPVFTTCGINSPNIMAVVYDQRTLQPKNVPGGPWDVCGAPPQRFYIFGADPTAIPDTMNNPNYATRQAQLLSFLNNVTDGDYVALISMNRVRWAGMPAAFRSQLAALLGSTLIPSLRNGDPLALVARKRSSGGTLVHELGPNPTNATPRYDQIVSDTITLRTPGSRGKIISTRIGPSQHWDTLYTWITKATATSSYVLKVQGVDTLNVVRDLPGLTNVIAGRSGLSLGGVSAAQYPYLQLELSLKDSLNRVSPQLREWFITFKNLPEGIVRRDLVAASAYDPTALAAQAAQNGSVSFPVKFVNVSSTDFGVPLNYKVELLDAQDRAVYTSPLLTVTPSSTQPGVSVAAGDTLTQVVQIPMIGRFGTFKPRVTINPASPGHPLPELYYFNNSLTLGTFTVVDHNVPPVLDVAVDGRHILNGELVSPSPSIRVQLRDEDRLRHIRSIDYFTLLLKGPGQAQFVPVDLRGGTVAFRIDSTSQAGSVAILDFQPGQAGALPDGMYTFKVQGRDPSSASAGPVEYEVKFEVVNASTITNVFPYPNPVVSKARFVFTVTGTELPRNMKIQIMTLTGAVVREIFMPELGPLHIGNNLTDYAWDGTDQYGDRLANGTYLYRVSLDDPNGQFSQRKTAADSAFKNDWGKLVLMR